MEHWVAAYRRVAGPPEPMRARLRTDAAGLLRSVTDDGEPPDSGHDGSVLLHLPAHVVGLDVSKQVRVRTGAPVDGAGRTVVPLQWEAEPARHAFPTFRGTVELEEHSVRSAEVMVVGAVVPPAGPLGAAIDALGLGAVAEGTVRYLADRLAEALHAVAAAPQTASH